MRHKSSDVNSILFRHVYPFNKNFPQLEHSTAQVQWRVSASHLPHQSAIPNHLREHLVRLLQSHNLELGVIHQREGQLVAESSLLDGLHIVVADLPYLIASDSCHIAYTFRIHMEIAMMILDCAVVLPNIDGGF